MSTSTFFYLNRKPLAVVEGTRLQLGGKDILVLLMPREYENPETRRKVDDIINGLIVRYPEQIITGAHHHDGPCRLFCSAATEKKILRKLGRNHRCGKIPIYEEE